MAAEDWLNLDDFEIEGSNTVCKRCGANDLHWEEARGPHNRKRWVLMEWNEEIHICPDAPRAASADEFPTIEPPNERPSVRHIQENSNHVTTRNVRSKRIAPVGTVPRKHDISRKPKRRRK